MSFQLNNLMKQAQEMQKKMQLAQKEIEEIEVEGESGAGVVKIIMDGKHHVKSFKLDPAILDENIDVIEDLIIAAINSSVQKIQDVSKQKLGSITAGMQLPKELTGL